GPWSDPDGALQRWLEQKDEILSGRLVREDELEEVTVKRLVNKFLNFKRNRIETGELSPRSFQDYYITAQRIMAAFGNRPVDDLKADDFGGLRRVMSKTMGAVAIGNEITRTKAIFQYGVKAGLIDKLPRYGPEFDKPSRKVLRLERAKNGERLFTAEAIQA